MVLDYRECRTRHDEWYFFKGVDENVSSYFKFFFIIKSILRNVGENFEGVLEVLEYFSWVKVRCPYQGC